MARRRFFVEAIQRGLAQITGPDAHHLTRVLRVEPGQKFEISDNLNAYLAEVETARKDLVSFRVLNQIEGREPLVHTALFASLIKFERFEWLLEKATELGMSEVTPVQTERSEKERHCNVHAAFPGTIGVLTDEDRRDCGCHIWKATIETDSYVAHVG